MSKKIKSLGEIEQDERIKENLELAIEEHGGLGLMSYNEFEEIFEDRDPFEFI
jgi:hypothetical protein